jgi:acyl-CoA thioester hydrolase
LQTLSAIAPHVTLDAFVTEAEIDPNQHMGSASYLNLFHRAHMAFFKPIGFGAAYRARGFLIFQKRINLAYEREMRLGDPVLVRSWLVGHDAKRIHHFHEMFRGRHGERTATAEIMTVNVEGATRRSAPFPADVQSGLETLARQYADASLPEGLGRRIALRQAADLQAVR